jgi:hypothetical protein
MDSALDSRPEPQAIRETFLDKDALARALTQAGIPVKSRSIDRWVRLGTGPVCTRIGGRPYFKTSHVDIWLKECEGRRPCRRTARESKSTSRPPISQPRTASSHPTQAMPRKRAR